MLNLSVYDLGAPLYTRLNQERRAASGRLVGLILVGVVAAVMIVIGGGFTFTALQYVLNPVLAALSGVLLHGCIALAIFLWIESRQTDNAGSKLAGGIMYLAASLVLLLIACARSARLSESRGPMVAVAISLAVYLMEMLLATGSAVWLQLAVDGYRTACRRVKDSEERLKSLLSSVDKHGWWQRYFDQLCATVRSLEQQVFHAFEGRSLFETRLQAVEAERAWVELNAPVLVARPTKVVVEPAYSLGAADRGNNHQHAV